MSTWMFNSKQYIDDCNYWCGITGICNNTGSELQGQHIQLISPAQAEKAIEHNMINIRRREYKTTYSYVSLTITRTQTRGALLTSNCPYNYRYIPEDSEYEYRDIKIGSVACIECEYNDYHDKDTIHCSYPER